MKIFELHTTNPNQRDINKITALLRDGEVMIFATDTVIAIGCALNSKKGIEKVLKVSKKESKKAKLSLVCQDIKHAAQFLLPMPNHIFRAMKDYTPGPYTFILKADSKTVKNLANKKQEIGIRIPKNEVIQDILSSLGQPIICTSLNKGDAYYTDFEDVINDYRHEVDILLQTELEEQAVSTVFDCTEDDLTLVREGKGVV